MTDVREMIARSIRETRHDAHTSYLDEADAVLAALDAAGLAVVSKDTLEAYVSDFCEGFCADCPADYADDVMLNDCSGCRARVALATAPKVTP